MPVQKDNILITKTKHLNKTPKISGGIMDYKKAFALFAFVGLSLSASADFADFGVERKWRSCIGGDEIELIEDYSKNIGSVYKVVANSAPKMWYLEIGPKKTPVVANNKSELDSLKFSFYILSSQSDCFDSAAMRFTDAKGEMFQIRASAFPKDGQWTLVEFTFPKKGKIESWGKDKDGKIDYPLCFHSLVVDYSRHNLNKPEFYIAKFNMQKQNAKK